MQEQAQAFSSPPPAIAPPLSLSANMAVVLYPAIKVVHVPSLSAVVLNVSQVYALALSGPKRLYVPDLNPTLVVVTPTPSMVIPSLLVFSAAKIPLRGS